MYEYQDRFRVVISYLVSQVIENDCFCFSYTQYQDFSSYYGLSLGIASALKPSRR